MRRQPRLAEKSPLLRELRDHILRAGKAESTAEAYLHWCYRYFDFCRHGSEWKHPKDCGAKDAEAFLTHLAVDQHVAESTQNQALSAILYLYRHLLKIDIGRLDACRAKKPQWVPPVLSRGEVGRLLDEMRGVYRLVAELMYGGGLRVGEAVSLRIKDMDLDRCAITVKQAKGKKDRETTLPETIHGKVLRQIAHVERLRQDDLRNGCAGVPLPKAYGRKSPSASTSLEWYWLFPSESTSIDLGTGKRGRYHVDAQSIQRAVKRAARDARITKSVKSHILRHSFATHMVENGVGIHTLAKLMGHSDIRTTEIYLHVAESAAAHVKSPLAEVLSRGPQKRSLLRRIREG